MTTAADTARTASADRHERWRVHVDAQARGTLSQRAYCEAHDLAYSSFTYWRRRVADRRQGSVSGETPRAAPTVAGPAFVPVRVTQAMRVADAGTALAVVLPSGVRIEGIAVANLRLVTALAAAL